LVTEAEAPLEVQQFTIQQPGGQGLQFEGLQFAWAKDSDMAKPLSRTKIINTCFISIRINNEEIIDLTKLSANASHNCHPAVTHLLNTCYGPMTICSTDVTLQDEVETKPPSYPIDCLYPGYGRACYLSIQMDQSFQGAV